MKIAIIMRPIDQDSGFQSYVLGLLDALLELDDPHEYLLLYRSRRFLGRFAASPKVKEVLVRAPTKLLWDHVAVPWHAWRERADVIFNPKFSVPLIAHCPVTMGLQEPAHWAWPEHYEKLNALYQRLVLPWYCRRAAHLFPMAHWILDENRKYLGLPLRQATVTWPAPRRELEPVVDHLALQDYRARRALPERFLLGVTRVDHPGLEGSTSFYPGKNPQVALRAFMRLRDRVPHHFVFVGRRVREFFRHLGFSETDLERVHCLDFLPFEELPALYGLADAAVHVPFYEGFGFGLMAALACGCPTVTSASGCCPEVVGDAALLADPTDPDDVARQILRVLGDDGLRAQLRERGLQRMGGLSWQTTARLTLQGLVEATAHGGSRATGHATMEDMDAS